MKLLLVAIEVLGLAGILVVGCAKDPGASRGRGVIRGTVTYRERIALPADAVVHVTLSDVAVQDRVAPLVTETRVPSEGKQVPLPFELRYDPAKIAENGTYAIRATIESGGRTWFTTDTAYHVLTRGNPAQADLLLVRAGGGGLLGTSWRLEDLGGAGVLDRVEATLEFTEEGKVSGGGSCNRVFGSVKIDGDRISFGPLGSTRMACPEAVSNQESKYLQALQAAERFTVDGATLSIHSKGMDAPLRFARVTP
jgi:putative lipoprotein